MPLQTSYITCGVEDKISEEIARRNVGTTCNLYLSFFLTYTSDCAHLTILSIFIVRKYESCRYGRYDTSNARLDLDN
jgi:hypothetical protein